jgi:uncharacterized protein (TIGR02466 family)
MNQPSILKLFPTCVMIFDLNEVNMSALKDIILSKQTYDHRLVIDNGRSSFGKENILDEPELLNLKNIILSSIKKYSLINGLAGQLAISNSWFNIMGPDGYIDLHRHEGSTLSGALYIDAPNGSSNLIFSSPLKPFRMSQIFNTEPNNIFNEGEIEIPVETGKLILFPSWLEHKTSKNKNEQRIVLSFNTIQLFN